MQSWCWSQVASKVLRGSVGATESVSADAITISAQPCGGVSAAKGIVAATAPVAVTAAISIRTKGQVSGHVLTNEHWRSDMATSEIVMQGIATGPRASLSHVYGYASLVAIPFWSAQLIHSRCAWHLRLDKDIVLPRIAAACVL